MWNKYELTESDFETKPQKTENYNIYITHLRQLYNIVKSNLNQVENVENEKDFEGFKMDFETIISEEDIKDGDFEGNDRVWERFRDEILPSYAVKKLDKKNIDEIKSTLKYILNLNEEVHEDVEDIEVEEDEE